MSFSIGIVWLFAGLLQPPQIQAYNECALF